MRGLINELEYELELKKFIEDNPLKTEADFLKQEIRAIENKLDKLKAEHQVKLEKLQQDYSTTSFKPEVIKEQIDYRLEFYRTLISGTKNRLSQFKNKLYRLPNQKAVGNQSLLLEGKKLNLSERIEIANAILNFSKVISELNVSDAEKNRVAAFILGNDVSNVRNAMSGTRTNKVREKLIESYLKSLGK